MPSNINPSLEPTKSLSNFRFWCQKVLPLVYDDSLSYYEVLGKMVAQLNDVIDDVNADTDNVLTLKDAFLELQTYVNNFFDDIDQLASYAERAEAAQTAANQSAINAASSASNASASSLAAMNARDTAVTAREAAQASANTATTASENATTKASEAAQSAITAQTAQASASQSATLAATDRSAAQTAASTATTKASEANASAENAEQSATDAEDAASRAEESVNNKAPVIVNSASGRIVQITDGADNMPVKDLTIAGVESANVTRTGKNLFDKSTITPNSWIIANSTAIEPNPGYFVSDYIPVEIGKTIICTPRSASRCIYYDEQKNPIAYFSWTQNAHTPLYNGYIRITDGNPNLNTLQIQYGSSLTTYEEYNGQTFLYPSETVKTFLGINNIWSDAGNISIAYCADSKIYIDSKIAELQATLLENIGG